MELDSTTMFPSGTNVMFIRSKQEPVLAQVVGHSEHGDACGHITYDRLARPYICSAPLTAAISVPANVRVRWWCGPPRGGVGDRHLATVPQGGGGPSSLGSGVGNDKGEGGW